MGKIHPSDIDRLKKGGHLSEEAVAMLEKKGLIGKRRHTAKKFMRTKEGNWVIPELCFKGLGKDTYSDDMTELKTKVLEAVSEYVTTKEVVESEIIEEIDEKTELRSSIVEPD